MAKLSRLCPHTRELGELASRLMKLPVVIQDGEVEVTTVLGFDFFLSSTLRSKASRAATIACNEAVSAWSVSGDVGQERAPMPNN